MKYKESDIGIAKYDDNGNLVGVYEKSSPEVKEWRQQQSAQQRRSSNTTTKKTQPKYSEPAGPKPQVNITTPKKKPWLQEAPEYYTTADDVILQPKREVQEVAGPRPQVSFPQYNRPWEQNLPEIARPGLQLQRADEAVQPGLAEARSIRRGQNIVDQIASTKNDTYFRTAETIQNLNARKENINDFYKKVDQLGIDGAINWYNKEINPYGMERYDEFTERTNQAEKESPRVFYKTIGELAETGKGGNVRQYHEWKNRVKFGDTEGERLRVALDVGNLSGDKLDKYYETLYNDGLNAATDYAMTASGYTAVPPQINEAEIQNEYVRLYQTSGQEAADEYLSSINDWYNSEYQKSYQDAFDRYVNDSINNTDFDSDEYTFARQIKGSAGKDRAFYERRLDTINNYEYMMENDPERERKIRAGENKTAKEETSEYAPVRFDALGNVDETKSTNTDKALLSEMNQKELDTYHYLRGTSDAKATEYLKAFEIKTQANRVAKQKLAAYNFGQKHLGLGTLANIGASTFAGMVSLPQQIAQTAIEMAGGEYMPNEVMAAYNPLLTNKNALAQGVADTIKNPVAKHLYESGVAMFNNISGVLLYNKYYPIVMTLNAAGEEIHQGLERGIPKDVALLNGGIAGAIEYLTEKMFFDDIMDAATKPITKNAKSKIRNLARASISNMGSEFGEEAVGALAQNIIDSMLTGDKSQLNAIINKNIANGMNKDDAARDAMIQLFVLDPLKNGVAGAISGGMLGGGYHYSNMMQYGTEVVNSNIGDTILTRAMSAPEGSNTKKIAVQITDALKAGKKVDTYSYGNMYAAMKEDGVKLTDKDMTATDKVNNLYLKKGGGVAGTVAASRLSWAQYQYLDELGKATGKNFVIQDFVEAEAKDGKTYDLANGVVKNNDNNVIYISANSENPLLATAKHELSHTLEQTESGRKFVNSIIAQIKKQDINGYNSAIERHKALYATVGEKPSDPKAEREIAADAAWKMLSRYTDVAALANKDVRLAKKIKGVVVDLLNAINGSNAKMEGVSGAVYDSMTKEQLQNIRRNFEMALGEDVAAGDANTATTISNVNMPQGIGTEATISEMETVQPLTNPLTNPITNTANPITNTPNIPQTRSTPDITQVLSKSESKTERDITKVLDKGGKRSVKNKAGAAEVNIPKEEAPTKDSEGNTLSPAQKKHFEKSKIKNENGELLVVYHGTPNGGFEEFEAARQGTSDKGMWGRGFYFTPDKRKAQVFANNPNGEVKKAYLNITNPFIFSDYKTVAEISDYLGVRKPVFRGDERAMFGVDSSGELFLNTKHSQEFSEAVKSKGHDGIVIEFNSNDAENPANAAEIIVFSNNNIELISDKKYSIKEKPTEVKVNLPGEEKNITNVISREEEEGRNITDVLKGKKSELERAVERKGEYNSANEIADEDYPDWFFGVPTPTDADAPPVIAQTEAERMLTEMRDAIFKVVGKKITYDNTEIRNIAKNFKKMYKSRASIEKVSTAIAEAYKAVAEVQNAESEEIDSDKIKNMIDLSEKAARIIIDSSDSIDRTLWDANKPVRDFIRQNVFRVNESIKRKFPEGGYNSFAEFLKANRGSIRISYTKGTPVDTLYNELVNNFPEWFTNAPSSAEEQLVWIADVLQDMRSTLVQDESGLSYDDKVQMLGSDILSVYTDAVFDIGTQQNIISEIERRKRDSIKRYYSDKYQDKIERDKERRQASEDRKKLLRIAKWLKNKRTSEYYREQIDELIHNLDTESIGFIKKGYDKVVKNPDGTETVTHVMDRLDIEKLAEEYNKLKEENPNFIVNTGVERKIARLRNVQIADMSIEEVRDLIDVLSNLQTEIMNSDRLIKSKRAERASKIAHDTKKRLEVVKGTGDSKFKISFDAYITGHVGAVAAARKFMGYQKNSSFVGVVEELNDGQRAAAKIQQEANAFFDKFLKDKKNRKFLENLDKKYTDYGNGVVITSGMRISLALLARNKNAAEHIMGGGMTIPNAKLLEKGKIKEAFYKGKTVQITQEQLAKIVKDITPEERQFAYLVDKLMNEYSKKKINETSLELYGYELANVTNYFPIRTNKVFIGTEVDNLSQSGTLEGMGILKERKPGAYTPIVLESVMDVVNRHINDVSKFAGLAIPLRNFKLVYGSASYVPTFDFDNSKQEKLTDYSSVQHSLTKTWGSQAKTYFDNLIQDIDTGGRQEDKTYSKILDTITGNVAKSALVMNLSTVLKQSAAYPTAGAVLGFGPLAKGLMHHVSAADKALYNRITPVIWLREKGYSMREISDYMEGSSIEKKVPALLGWIQQSDVAISYKICKAAEMYVNSHYNYKKGSKQWEKALADTINKAIEKTQQSSTTMQRAAILRSPNSLVKAFNMFKSQSYLQTELLLDAVGEYNAWRKDKKAGRNITDKDISESRRRLANVISAQVVASTMMSAIEIVWRAISAGDKEWEDEEGKFRWSNLLKNFFKRIIFNIAGQVEFGTEVSDIVYAALTGDRYYGVDVASAGLITDMGEAIVRGVSRAEETIDTVKNKKYFDWHEEIMPIEKDLEKLLAIFGVPLANVRKVIQTGYNTVLSAAEKVKPGSTESFQKNIKTVLYGSTAVFNDEKSAAYKELKTNMGERQAEQNARKYSKTYDVMKAFKDYAAKNPSKKKEIQENMKKYADYIKTFDLPDDIRKMYDDLYVELEKEYGREEANKTLPLYTPTSELSIEYGGETIKYKLSPDEYNDYLYKLIEADTEVYKQLASDPYFAEQSAEVKLKMLKRARDAKVNEVETAIVEEKKGFTEEQQKAQRTKQYNAVTEFKGTAGKDYVKLDDIYYEVSPETYQKYTEYVNSNINNIMSALESGTPLNSIKGFEKTYFMQNNKRVKPNQAFSSYGVVIQEKIKNKVKETVKESFLTDVKKQNPTQAAITQEILSSKYKYYKSDDVLKNIDSGDFSQNVWVRTDGQIVKKKK